MRCLLLLLAVLAGSAYAQYSGPAVEACRAYAERQAGKKAVIDRDRELVIERYTKKLGSQSVASVLTGNGAIVLEGAPAAELSFVCLLADEKRPLFFHWMPRHNATVLAQCARDDKVRTKPRACFDYLLTVAEADLGQLYAERFQEARERDSRGGGEAAVTAYRKSNDQWREYRDAECARKRDLAPAGVSPEDAQAACMVELSRRRAADMR